MDPRYLFKYGEKRVGAKDMADALRRVGVKKGDALFVHAGLRRIGTLGPNYTKAGLCTPIIRTLQQSVGPQGTVVMPTFTYAFCRGAPFDRQKSPSEVGMLSEFFRSRRGVRRSQHPIFSVAACGAKSRSLARVGSDSFGAGSFFDMFLKLDGVVVLFGGAPFSTATFYHVVEQAHGVPYRFMKTFKGVRIDRGRRKKVAATFFVRPLDGSVENDVSGLERRLLRKKLLRRVRVGGAYIQAVRAADLHREGMAMLDENVNALLAARTGKSYSVLTVSSP